MALIIKKSDRSSVAGTHNHFLSHLQSAKTVKILEERKVQKTVAVTLNNMYTIPLSPISVEFAVDVQLKREKECPRKEERQLTHP